ncbi:MAG: polynucleotide adenylyltransferase PcnB, partial [Rhodoferax sp.]|nr:polynucleotide adenylyltransferase PcnB [Rhodoferax sp.]
FMRLRAETGEIEEVLADWWQEFSMANDNLRADMVEQVRAEQGRGKATRAPRPPRKRSATPAAEGADPAPSDASAGATAATEDGEPASDAPRKRRRRRRPGGARPGGDAGNTPEA